MLFERRERCAQGGRAWPRWLAGLVVLCAGALTSAAAAAVPLLQVPGDAAGVDLRTTWQLGVLDADPTARSTSLLTLEPADPEAIWSLGAERFVRGEAAQRSVMLEPGQRLVARLRVNVQPPVPVLHLELPMARLDWARVSYRSPGGPWTTAVAGDRVPMSQWHLPGRYPHFEMPADDGVLDVVIEAVHAGRLELPAQVSSGSAFQRAAMARNLSEGGLLGLCLTVSVVGFLMGGTFRRIGFTVIGLMTLAFSAAVAGSSGLAGVYLFTDSAVVNDLGKFALSAVAASLLPFTVSGVLDQRFAARRIWQGTLAWMAVCILGAMAWLWFEAASSPYRFAVLTTVVFASALGAVGLALWALARQEAHARWVVWGVLLLCLGALLPLFSLLGALGGLTPDGSFVASGLVLLPGVLCLMNAVFLQYRQGRSVLLPLDMHDGRDGLTGLYNRRGLDQELARVSLRLRSTKTCAAFYLIELPSPDELRYEHGEEGFEQGMVRVAAALAGSLRPKDVVARVARSEFAAAVLMPRQTTLASETATKMFSHLLNLSAQAAPMSRSTRIAIAWMPDYGTALEELREQCLAALRHAPETQKIVWVS